MQATTPDVLLNREESIRQLTNLANALPQLVWIAEPDGKVIYYNDRVTEFAGARKMEDGNWSWEGLLHDDDRHPTAEAWSNAVQTGQLYEKEHRVKMKDGVYRWHLSRAFPQKNEHQQIIKWFGTATDIHEVKLAQEKIRESESRFRSLAENSPDIITRHGRDHRYLYANAPVSIKTGVNNTDMIGKTFRDLEFPEELCRFLDSQLEMVFTTGEPHEVEFYSPIGQSYFYSRLVPEFNDQNEVETVLVISTDITERKLGEKSVLDNVNRYRHIFEGTPVSIWEEDFSAVYAAIKALRARGVLDFPSYFEKYPGQLDALVRSIRIKDINAATVELLEANSKEEIKNGLHNIFIDDTRSAFISEFEMIATGGGQFEYETVVRTIKGNRIETLVQIDFPEDGDYSSILVTMTDISERKKAENILRKSEEHFRTLAETLPQLIWMLNNNGEQVYISSNWKKYTGFKDINSETWQQIVHPDDYQKIMDTWEQSFADASVYKTEVRLKNHNGEYRWFAVQGDPIRNEKGRIINWIGAFTDVHDQKALAEMLERSVTERTKELQRSNEDLQQFAHVASHDLKEPVRKVRTFISRINEEYAHLFPEKVKTYLSKMESASQRMYSMIDGVLMYSTYNALEQLSENVNLNDIIHSIESDLELAIHEKEAVIQYNHLPTINGSPVLLYQLFYNLLNNALKFSKPDVPPRISIEASTGSQETKITVSDNGIGFAPGEKDRIFKTFSRLHARDKYEGTGLGLALCKKIVERHGGRIEADAEEGKGACFHIYLPVVS